MIPDDFTIGVLDSGVGGLRLLAASARALPSAQFIYLGDFADGPYGSLSSDAVAARVRKRCDDLLARGAKALVLACNTATSASVADLRARLDVPVVGMEPAVKPAVLDHPIGRVLVLATELTLREAKFRDLLERVAGGATIDPLPCPGLADAVDGGDIEEAGRVVQTILDQHPTARSADAVVLGCTHYAFVREAIEEWFAPRDVKVYDGVEGTVRRLVEVVGVAPGADERVEDDRVTLLLPGADVATERHACGVFQRMLRSNQ